MGYTSSDPLVLFVQGHEGFASKAYRCPAGVITIGYGFTMRDPIFAAYWLKMHREPLRMGDTITLKESVILLRQILDGDYGRPVTAEIKPDRQNVYDGATSACFNFGAGGLKWRWAQALKARDIPGGAALLRTTATTANGRTLPGLVRRRREEATIIETGVYPGVKEGAPPPSVSTSPEAVAQYTEWLRQLGYAPTLGTPMDAVIRAFQLDHGLKSDGKVGPATRAALLRALDAKKHGKIATAGGAAGTGGGLAAQDVTGGLDPTQILHMLPYALGAALLALAIFTIFRYRGLITGQRVAT